MTQNSWYSDTTVQIAKGGTGQTTFTDGQLLIGNTTGNTLAKATITAGAGVTVTNGAGSITIASTGGGLAWSEETGATLSLVGDNGYITNRSTQIAATLPATCAVGKTIYVANKGAGGVRIGQNAGQTIYTADSSTTAGVGGYIENIYRYAAVELVCITADTDFMIVAGYGGNFTIL